VASGLRGDDTSPPFLREGGVLGLPLQPSAPAEATPVDQEKARATALRLAALFVFTVGLRPRRMCPQRSVAVFFGTLKV